MLMWNFIIQYLKQLPPKTFQQITKTQIIHPLFAGAEKGFGLFRGQNYDFRFSLDDGSALHVQEFDDYYEVHIDQVDPKLDLIEHLRVDAPGIYVAGACATGAAIGTVINGKKGAITGTLIGLAIGLGNL